MSTSTFEWDNRASYALTELILFILTSLVIVIAATLSFALIYWSMVRGENNKTYLLILRPLFDNVLPSAIAFTAVDVPAVETTRNNRPKVNIVLLGHQERMSKKEKNEHRKDRIRRLWVQVYLVLLCFLVVLWAVSVFSDSVLYRKTSSCSDHDVEDTDLSCFLISTRNIPEGVQQIIDDEKDPVPCKKVQNYINSQNSTYDLEVICYQSILSPLAAVGVAYGAMKTIAFGITLILSVILILTKNCNDPSNCKILIGQTLQLFFSFVITAIVLTVIALLHVVTGARNSAFDYLRGEKFYNFSVVVLTPVTIIFTLGLFPWWAFKPLEDPTESTEAYFDEKNGKFTREFRLIVHKMILHQKFSTGMGPLIKIVVKEAANRLVDQFGGNRTENGSDGDQKERPQSNVTD